VTLPAGRYVIGFNASALPDAASAAIAIDDVVLLPNSCDVQGINTNNSMYCSGPLNIRGMTAERAAAFFSNVTLV